MFESVFSLLSGRQDSVAPKGNPSGKESGDGDTFRALFANRNSTETTRDPSTSDTATFLFGVAPPAHAANAQPIVSELNTTISEQFGATPAQQHRLAIIEAHDLTGGPTGQTPQIAVDTRANTPTLSQPTSFQNAPSITGIDLSLDTLPAASMNTRNSAITASVATESNITISDAMETIQATNPKHATPPILLGDTEAGLRTSPAQPGAAFSAPVAQSSLENALGFGQTTGETLTAPAGTNTTIAAPTATHVISGEPGLANPIIAKNMRALAESETVQSPSEKPALKSANSSAVPETAATSAEPAAHQASLTAEEASVAPQSELRNQTQPSEAVSGVVTSPAPTSTKSDDAAPKRARSTTTADAAVSAPATPASQVNTTSPNPASELATAVQDVSADPVSPSATLGPTTTGTTPLNLASTTAPSFNPASPSGQTSVIVASPADVPGVVAQTLAQNESTERISIQLDPPELGRVSIEFQIDDSGVHTVTVTSETSEALRKLRLMNFELLQALEQQGLGGRSFSLEYQHSEQAEHWAESSEDHANDDNTQGQTAQQNWPDETLRATRLSDPSQLGEGGLNLRL